MAMDFNGTTQWLTGNSSLGLTGIPLTMSCWINPDVAASGAAFCLQDTGANAEGIYLSHGLLTPSRIQFATREGGGIFRNAESTTTLAAGTWGHIAGVATSSTSRTVYLNAANNATDVNSVSLDTLERAEIATRTSGAALFNGKIAECAAWNVALTQPEILILALGFSALLVRPDSLVFYAPLIGRYSPEIDLITGNTLTYVASPVAFEHPRIRRATGPEQAYKIASLVASGRIWTLASEGGLVGPSRGLAG